MKHEVGQTLIETIVAIFVLTLALSGGLALAIFALSRADTSFNQIISTNLAREGVDVVRMMRDSNWLASDAKAAAWDLTSCADIGGSLCYPRTFQKVPPYNDFDLDPGSYRAEFSTNTRQWSLENNNDYNLYQQADGAYAHTTNGISSFARQIKISQNTAAPYTNQNSNWELIVKSTIVWRGKNCPSFVGNEDLEVLNTQCKVTVEERLTNWKDYK